MAHRMETVDGDLDEELFVLMTLGDDRAVSATYVQGWPVWQQQFSFSVSRRFLDGVMERRLG
jgi:hypothetical protein